MAFTLWHGFLRSQPSDPAWPGRDRFVLSAGHGSMLLYGLLHLFGYPLPIEELRRFRQSGSLTPGHPEYGHTPGVEMTTGPLGQGFASGVGLALASRMASARLADGQFDPGAYRVFGLVSDGDLMEGVSSEAASLAGHLRLGNLVYLYDDNRISIEGDTALASSENSAMRLAACGWHVQRVDGHDPAQVSAAIAAALAVTDQPSLIVARTRIAYGSPGKEGTAAAHGSPLGAAEVAATRARLGWPDETFHVPAAVRELCAARQQAWQADYAAWQTAFAAWQERNPQGAELWQQLRQQPLPADLTAQLLTAVGEQAGATRALAGTALQRGAALLPSLVSGSADLSPSTNTAIAGAPAVAPGEFAGRNLHYGVREHAMAAVMNGLALSGFFRPVGSTFLVFADYCRPSLRLAALMGLPVVHVYTHDSLFVGEDGPTHQPVEQLASLRLIPNLQVLRPADAAEVAVAWALALERRDGPTALVLTRQKLPFLPRPGGVDPAAIRRGGYLLRSGGTSPAAVLMASGSEVSLALAAAELLAPAGIPVQVLSVPDRERFLAQPASYRQALLPAGVPRIALEAAHPEPWWQLVGEAGLCLGMTRFGASAPAEALAEQFGFTAPQVAARIQAFLAAGSSPAA